MTVSPSKRLFRQIIPFRSADVDGQHARILNLRQLLAMLAAGIPIPAIAGSIRELISTYA